MFLLYLDPGSGSFLIQLLIAGLAGIGLAIGSSWAKIKRLFSGKRTAATEEPAEDDEEE